MDTFKHLCILHAGTLIYGAPFIILVVIMSEKQYTDKLVLVATSESG